MNFYRKTADIISRSERTYSVLYSHFLTPAEQLLLGRVDEFMGKISFEGGYEEAERRMCRVRTDEYQPDEGAPMELLGISATAPDAEINHRDVLGSLMGLGIKREMIGDIIITEKGALVFCDSTVPSYIEMNLERIGRYRVSIKPSELSDIPEPKMKKVSINISSPRLDSICAECFGLSRTKAAEAIKKGLVSINWQICDNVSRELTGGERISLRGKGKVRFSGITGKSKKGRLFAQIEKY